MELLGCFLYVSNTLMNSRRKICFLSSSRLLGIISRGLRILLVLMDLKCFLVGILVDLAWLSPWPGRGDSVCKSNMEFVPVQASLINGWINCSTPTFSCFSRWMTCPHFWEWVALSLCSFISLFQDYYSIPFPTPTTPLTGRDGSLASNPYSGRIGMGLNKGKLCWPWWQKPD